MRRVSNDCLHRFMNVPNQQKNKKLPKKQPKQQIINLRPKIQCFKKKKEIKPICLRRF